MANIFTRKTLLGLSSAVDTATTTIKSWANERFALKSSVKDPINFAPDFSRKKLLYKSSDASDGRGFRIRNCSDETTICLAKVFKLKYPCFIYNEHYRITELDTDMILEISSNETTCIGHNDHSNGLQTYSALKYRDSTYSAVSCCGCQNLSFFMPLGTVGYWHHYATGAFGSSDDGDNLYRAYYIVPAYGTPSGTELIELYDATFHGQKARVSKNDSTIVWLNVLKSTSNKKSITV